MAGTKMTYEAPTVRFMKFDENDILRTSGWDLDCHTHGEGFNAEPPDCSIDVTTDNSMN